LVYATAVTTKNYTIDLPGVSSDTGTAKIRGSLVGFTANPQHFTNIYINNKSNLVSSRVWASKGEIAFEVDVPQSYLVEGTNTIMVECPMSDGTNPITLDAFYVNWFEVEYLKTYQAGSTQVVVFGEGTGNKNYQVTGIESNDKLVFDITDPYQPIMITDSQFILDPVGGTYTLSFQQSISTRRKYIAAAPGSMITPSSIDEVVANDLRNSLNTVDYLIISYASFIPAIQPLVIHHIGEGLRVMVVDVQQIYDEFSYGVFDPTAIRTFMKFAYNNWAVAPTYVLLVGDGNYDFKNYLGKNQPNYVPVYLANVDPWLGEIAADNRYVDISGDDLLPDLAIGRLPVMSSAETTNIVNKIIAYEGTTTGTWVGNTLLVAGKNDPSSGNFPASSDTILNEYLGPKGFLADKVYYQTTYPDIATTRQAIIDAFNEGRGIIHYTGHSTPVAWYGDPTDPNNSEVFNLSSISSLENFNKLPIIISMTCLVGNFNNPYIRSLDETLLITQNTGSVASFSPVGKGLSVGHDLLDHGLFDALLVKKITDLGSATNLAKYYLYANSTSNWDLLDTFTMLGDPALRFPTKPTAVDLNYFRAHKASTGVELTWETASETTTAGFNLYRRELSGEFIKLNTEYIPTKNGGQPLGSTYTYLDTTAVPGVVYEYKLDVIENSLQVSTSVMVTYWPYSVMLPLLQR